MDREKGSIVGWGGVFNFPPADKGNKFLSQTLIF